MSKISFECNTQKTMEVMLWVMNREKNGINLYNLVKTIFHADCYHLNHYRRPVTGDVYMAMQFGTVPSFVYDIISQNPFALSEFPENLPFEKKRNFLFSKRDFNAALLSESDIEALEEGFKEYGRLPFEQVKNKNHTHSAWKKAYENAPNSMIPFEDLITNKDVLENLSDIFPYSIKV